MVVILRESVLRYRKDRCGCRRAFGQTWAKLLRNHGDFVVLVNAKLTRAAARAIILRCGFAATPQRPT
jgi:hypothetical protein